MEFIFGAVTFILGAALVAICLFAIPGPETEEHPAESHGHGHGH